jgi:hypothetical protein
MSSSPFIKGVLVGLSAALISGTVVFYVLTGRKKRTTKSAVSIAASQLENEFRVPTYKLFGIVKHFVTELNKVVSTHTFIQNMKFVGLGSTEPNATCPSKLCYSFTKWQRDGYVISQPFVENKQMFTQVNFWHWTWVELICVFAR